MYVCVCVCVRVCVLSTTPGGGGGHSTFMWQGGGGGVTDTGGRKPDPVAMRSVHKKHTLSQYTLLKNVHMHTLSQYFTVAGCPDRELVINIVGWEALGRNPVINGVARQ